MYEKTCPTCKRVIASGPSKEGVDAAFEAHLKGSPCGQKKAAKK